MTYRLEICQTGFPDVSRCTPNTALGLSDLEGWFTQLAALKNPVRREFHLFMLLSGHRPEAIRKARSSMSIFLPVSCTYPDRRAARSKHSISRFRTP